LWYNEETSGSPTTNLISKPEPDRLLLAIRCRDCLLSGKFVAEIPDLLGAFAKVAARVVDKFPMYPLNAPTRYQSVI
jgi:hypothetical protein